jgi:alcohol dehydrogenase
MDQAPEPFTFFHSARRVIFAWSALEHLADLAKEAGARRAAMVVDAFFLKTPLAARLADILKQATGVASILHGVPAHEPDLAGIEACRASLAAADPDLIVAIGGGSAMDTAKIARMALANPGPIESIAGFGKTMRPHRSLLVAVPTTAGTGSEVSESAIAGKDGLEAKLIFRSPEMTPQIALLDPSLTVSAPPAVTAYSGYDAVTHAVEAYVSRAASIMTDPLAENAMALLARHLPVAYRAPDDRTARSYCLIASCQAAIAFNSANLGLAHAFAAPLGALHHVPHGLANALALPAVTAYNEPMLGEKGRTIARLFAAAGAAEGVAKLRHAIGLDRGLDEFVPTDDARERLAQVASRSGQVKMNPRLATIDHLRALAEAMRRPTGASRPEISL